MKIKILYMILGLSFCIGCVENPISGRQQLIFFDPNDDIKLGNQYAPEIEKQLGGQIPDVGIQNYLSQIGREIAAVSDNQKFEYHYTALNDKMVNAFALPGGRIFITKGMLEKLQSESQLASILAHETVHVVARHSSEQMTYQIGTQLLLSAVLSDSTSSIAAGYATKIIGLKYSRRDEQEADIGGMKYMVKAGYNPQGMVETMEMLQKEAESAPIEFLSTHPSPKNRIGYLKEEITKNYSDTASLKVNNQDYQKYVLDKLKLLPAPPAKTSKN